MTLKNEIAEKKAICPHCHESKNVKRHGMRNGIQRYYCNNCKKAFQLTKKRIKYLTNKKTLLAILLGILNAEKGTPQKEVFDNIKEMIKNVGSYKLYERELPSFAEIACMNPRLLICENNNAIIYYKLNPESWSENRIIVRDSLRRR